jgi:hypothetical protein
MDQTHQWKGHVARHGTKLENRSHHVGVVLVAVLVDGRPNAERHWYGDMLMSGPRHCGLPRTSMPWSRLMNFWSQRNMRWAYEIVAGASPF